MTVDLLVKVRVAVKMHDGRSPGQGPMQSRCMTVDLLVKVRDAVKMHDGRSPGHGPGCCQDA